MRINGIHQYKGLCPDDVNGPYSRDPENCELCKALTETEKQEKVMIQIADELAREWLDAIPEFKENARQFPELFSTTFLVATFSLLETALQDRLDTCKWKSSPEYFDIFDTSCGKEFCTREGEELDSEMKFCTYCGKKLKTQVD